MAVMKIKKLLPLSFFLLAMPVAATNVYITIDENGNRVFSDKPSSDAQKHKVRKIQTVPAVKLPVAKPKAEKEVVASSYESLQITNPVAGTVIHRGMTGNFSVMSSLKPALQEGDEVVLLINGQTFSQGSNTSWQLNNIDRGEHSLQVQVRNIETQEVQISSPTVQVIVQRNSIN